MSNQNCQRCGTPIPNGVDRCSECKLSLQSNGTAEFRFATGEIIDSRYEVIHRIPGGGMGELYKVRHLHLNDIRAIKLLRSDQLGDETYRKRFLREARLAASIKHPNVGLLHDFANLPDNTWYMVEEFIEGTTLAKSLRSGRRFSLDEIVEIARQVLLGLGAIHDKGIIHRDISPDNIMLADSKAGGMRCKIIDLGIARSVDTTEAQSLTSAGLFIGKPHYASPEQMRLLEDDDPIDHRTDLYSLGVVLYEVVSGKVPFEASTPFAYLMKQLSEDATPIDRTISDLVPPDLEAFIKTLLRAKRDDRFQSSIDALLALSKIRVGKATLMQDVRVPGDDTPYPATPPAKKRRQTAEVPIQQLQNLIEQDRTESVRRPVPVVPEPEVPDVDPPQSDAFDDSQKVTFVQSLPVSQTKDVPRPSLPDDEPEQEQVQVEIDESEPVAFIPELPSPIEVPASQPDTGPSSPTQSGTNRNPFVWFAAGIIFVAVVAVGGYLFYRWLDTTFGSKDAPTEVAAPAPVEPDPTEPATDTVEVSEIETVDTDTVGEGTAPVVDDDPVATPTITTPPAPRPVATTPPPRTRPTPVPPPQSPPTSTDTVADDSASEESQAAEATDTTAGAETPATAPVVLPGSTDDVREGDLVAPGPGVIDAKVIKTVQPIYPPLSSDMKHEGVAMFSVLVGPDGEVEVLKLIISTGAEPLDKSAEDAAYQTIFEPATKNGVKVRQWRTLRFQFKRTRGY